MKTTKRIIIRIIVAVAVAVILSKLKLIGIMSVSALTGRFNPNEAAILSNSNGVIGSTSSLTSFSANASTFYGWRNENQSYINTIRYKISSGSNYNGKQFLLSFLVYFGGYTRQMITPHTVYIKDTNNRISYCTSELGVNSLGTSYGFNSNAVQSVTCNNVLIGTNDFYVYIIYDDYVMNDSYYGMTQLIMIENNDSQILQAIQNQNNTQTQIQNNTKETNDLIKNDDTSAASSSGSSFFNNFDASIPGGLSGVITAPLSFIQSLTSKQCSPLQLNLGIVNKQFSLPCATTFMQQNFSDLLSFYQLVTHGLVGYLILVKIFALVKDFKNPDSDKIEVLDL